ncbi:MAG: VCBS repeat-containing protein [Pseudomonadota bacterium]
MAQTVTAARYAAPTDRYAHGILGDPIEWGALELTLSSGDVRRFVLPVDHVFEDVAPRLADLDGDGAPEVIVVETDVSAGGALAVYGPRGKIAETPHIGTRNRWLAPIGAADLDGDGAIEIAFIDRPHLAKTLRVWRYAAGGLREVASLQGFTNHRIGEVDIAGGVRTCNGIPEMIVASANWSRLVSVSWVDAAFAHKDIGRDTTRAAFGRAMACIP